MSWRITFSVTCDIPAPGCKSEEEARAFFESAVGQEMVGEALAHNSPEITDVYDDEEIKFSFDDGTVCIYDSHGGDSTLNERTGERCTVLRALTEEEADLADVGPMYEIQFEKDGFTTDAFGDELTPV